MSAYDMNKGPQFDYYDNTKIRWTSPSSLLTFWKTVEGVPMGSVSKTYPPSEAVEK